MVAEVCPAYARERVVRARLAFKEGVVLPVTGSCAMVSPGLSGRGSNEVNRIFNVFRVWGVSKHKVFATDSTNRGPGLAAPAKKQSIRTSRS